MAPRKTVLEEVDVSSHTRPDKTYKITVYEDADPWCSCPAHRFQPNLRPCKHIKAMLFAVNQIQGTPLEQISGEFKDNFATFDELCDFDFRDLSGVSVACSDVEGGEWFDFNI